MNQNLPVSGKTACASTYLIIKHFLQFSTTALSLPTRSYMS